jgi:membrane protein
VLDVVVFTALYKLTPTVIVCVPAAVTGAIAAAVLWEASKVAFGWWVVEVGSYNRVYGPLAASVIVMLWLWVSAMIFLYGAEVSAAAQRRLAVAESAQVGAPNSV